MRVFHNIKALFPRKLKLYLKDLLGFNVSIFEVSLVTQRQTIDIDFSDLNITYIADRSIPLYHTVQEIFDFDCYFLSDYISVLKNACVVDVGANIGIFSIFCIKKGAVVISIEPDKENISLFKENLRINNAEVEIKNNALSSVEQQLIFNKTLVGVGVSSAVDMTDDDTATTFSVQTVTLDNIIKEVKSCNRSLNILKMDIEGGEYDLFRNSTEEILFFDIIVMEIHDISYVNSRDAIIRVLQTAGYDVKIKRDSYNRNGLCTIIAKKSK